MQTQVTVKSIIDHNEVEITFYVEYSTRQNRDTSFEEYYEEIDSFNILSWTAYDDISDEDIEDWLLLNEQTIKDQIL